MKLVTSKQMRELDRHAVERHGIPSLVLMERAGKSAAEIIVEFVKGKRGQVVVVAGRGNNGGDGLVAARHLINSGIETSVILLARPTDLSPDARANFELLVPLTIHIQTIPDAGSLGSAIMSLGSAACIVDAILGTGFNQEVAGLYRQAIEYINALARPVVSIDVPSGLSADTGMPQGAAIIAKTTITLGLPKIGLFIGRGADFAGHVRVADIGIPEVEIKHIQSVIELIDPTIFADKFGPRDPKAHKGTYGHVVVFAGCLGHLGAGYLACLAALRSGAGLATYCLPQKAFVRFDARYPEIMCDPIPDDAGAFFHPVGIDAALKICEGKSVAAIGPAIGTDKKTREFVNLFVKRAVLPIVIDADGLNVLETISLKDRHKITVLTPHPGEMARLSNTSVKEIESNRMGAAQRFAASSGSIVILKGHNTVVAFPDGATFVNPTGNAGMATAGMGDALTGIVASFIAQHVEIKKACLAAVYIHGLAGDMAALEHGERALITSDVIGKLGSAINSINK